MTHNDYIAINIFLSMLLALFGIIFGIVYSYNLFLFGNFCITYMVGVIVADIRLNDGMGAVHFIVRAMVW